MDRVYESAAQTAKKVRATLKTEFPAVKFSVRSSSYSGGSSVHVEWTDGPASDAVDAVLSRFSSASFDGMQDLKSTHGYTYDGVVYVGADWVTGSRNLSDEYRAKVEAYLPDGITRNDWEYHRHFQRAEEELIASEKSNNTTQTPAPEGATVETSEGVTVTLNADHNGIEIRFPSKPAAGIIAMLKENGFRWSNRGFWYAKQTPERLTLANALANVDTTPDAVEVDTPTDEVLHKIEWANNQVKFLQQVASGFGFDAIQARVKLEKIRSLSESEYIEAAIEAYDANHPTKPTPPKTGKSDADTLDDLPDFEPLDAANLADTDARIATSDTSQPDTVKRVYITVKRPGWSDSFLVPAAHVTKPDEHGHTTYDHDAARAEIVAHYPQLSAGDYAYQLDHCDYEYVPPTQPREFADGERVPMSRIVFTWSESNTIHGGEIFTSWSDANELIRRAEREHAEQYGIGGGYFKTGFIVVFEDNYIYEGRIDINETDNNLIEHIREHLEFHAGIWTPSHMTKERHEEYLNSCNVDRAEYQSILARYILGDVTEPTPTQPTRKPSAKVINLFDKRAEKVTTFTPVQRLMLHTIQEFADAETIALAIAEGVTVERLFEIAALAADQQRTKLQPTT